MSFFMGIIKGKNGVFYARKKVPRGCEEKVAIAAGSDRPSLSWLKRSLGTKDRRKAAVLAKPVLIEFDAILAKARSAELTTAQSDLTPAKIEGIAAYHYAATLEEDEKSRIHGLGSEALFIKIQQQLTDAGIEYLTPHKSTGVAKFGLSENEYLKMVDTTETVSELTKMALARGDLTIIEDELEDLIAVFNLKLDIDSEDFRNLGYAVLKAHACALDAIRCAPVADCSRYDSLRSVGSWNGQSFLI